MNPFSFLRFAVAWAFVTAGAQAQISTFPSPPPLNPPSDHQSVEGPINPSRPASESSESIETPGSVSEKKSTSTPPATNAAPASPVAAATLTSMSALDDKIPLSVGDTVSIRILEDRDDPVTRIVTDTGEVNFPYIGRLKVEGKTCHQVAIEAKKLLEVDYYKRATVIVGLDLIEGQDKTKAKDMVWVVGEVKEVGPQELTKAQPLTVSQIILRAGGFGDFADQRKVKVIHRDPKATATDQPPNVSEVKDAQEVDVKSVFDGKSTADPFVKSGDYIIVPKKFFNY